jgi:hypothetical protein
MLPALLPRAARLTFALLGIGSIVLLNGCGEAGNRKTASPERGGGDGHHKMASPEQVGGAGHRKMVGGAGHRKMGSPKRMPIALLGAPKPEIHNTESYDHIIENSFLGAERNPLSTFSIDVDSASYSNIRSFLLTAGCLPPPDAVRTEELINYFPYRYPRPKGGHPVAFTLDLAECPWVFIHGSKLPSGSWIDSPAA